MHTPQEIIDFWFTPPMNQHWFTSTEQIDTDIRSRYEALWQSAQTDTLTDWQTTPEGCLALCIVLDQFPLNMFRNSPLAFSTEAKAIEICKHAITRQWDKQLPLVQRAFLYMPLMHSENMADQEQSVALYEASGLDDNARFARHHRDIVARYGRFPHRNALLGRTSTADEIDYLNSPEAFTG